MRVFISHSSKDKPAVEPLVHALRERGFDPWFDKWEIGPGDDIVASINAGLDEAGAGIIAFSRHSQESRWVEVEVSYLTYARIQEEKILIPVMVSDDAWVPPLLRPLARRGIEEIDALMRGGEGRMPHVTQKLKDVLAKHEIELHPRGDPLEERPAPCARVP